MNLQTWPNKITGPNAGGRYHVPMPTPLAARVAELTVVAPGAILQPAAPPMNNFG